MSAELCLPPCADEEPAEVLHILDAAPDSGPPLFILRLLEAVDLARVACVKRSWRSLVFRHRDALWPPLARRFVHDANVWVRATRFDVERWCTDNFTPPADSTYRSWMEPEASAPGRDFLAHAPAYGVARTHECVRDSALMKLYAPLAKAEEAALLDFADHRAVDSLLEDDPDGYGLHMVMFGLLEIESLFLEVSWVQRSVHALECLAGLLCSRSISLSLLVHVSLRKVDTTDFETAERAGRERQQTLLEWLAEHTHHFGEARMRKLIAVAREAAERHSSE